MTDREFKRLSRAQLIEIIYQLQLKEEELNAENQKLCAELEDKRIRMHQVGNIAEAALGINQVMQAAQSAADQYLEEIRRMHAETEAACRRMLKKARKEAADIVEQAKLQPPKEENTLEAILEEFKAYL